MMVCILPLLLTWVGVLSPRTKSYTARLRLLSRRSPGCATGSLEPVPRYVKRRNPSRSALVPVVQARDRGAYVFIDIGAHRGPLQRVRLLAEWVRTRAFHFANPWSEGRMVGLSSSRGSRRSEERRVGKECRSRWAREH